MRPKIILLSLIMTMSLTACDYDGRYRYTCQDPANWELAECKPPVCNVDNTCPSDINSNLTEEKNG